MRTPRSLSWSVLVPFGGPWVSRPHSRLKSCFKTCRHGLCSGVDKCCGQLNNCFGFFYTFLHGLKCVSELVPIRSCAFDGPNHSLAGTWASNGWSPAVFFLRSSSVLARSKAYPFARSANQSLTVQVRLLDLSFIYLLAVVLSSQNDWIW